MSPLFFVADNYWLEIAASNISNTKKPMDLMSRSGDFNLEMVWVLFVEGEEGG